MRLPKQATVWTVEDFGNYNSDYTTDGAYEMEYSKYNPTPGTGRTGYIGVPPNNYPFYKEEERYTPILQADGGQLSEWKPLYNPTKEQAEIDRAAAYESGVPHGYIPPSDKYKDLPKIDLWVESELHDETEYGANVDKDGNHSGGIFKISISPKMRIEEIRNIIRDVGGILPALQRYSYAGKHLVDSQRTLEQYGVAYWHSKFPHWPLKIRKF